MSDIAIESSAPGQASDVSSQPDTTSSFSFSGIHEKALAELESNNTPAGEQVVDPGVQAGAVTPPAENVDNASAAQLAQLKDTDLVEVTVDGQSVQMPWAEAKGGVMRQAKFTKEMTTLRQQERDFQANRQSFEQDRQDKAVLTGLLQNKELLRSFLQKQHPDLLSAATAQAAKEVVSDPDDIATVGQLAEIEARAQAKVQEITQGLVQELKNHEARVTANLEDRAATVKLANEINSTIKGLFDTHPHISKVIPNAEDILRWTVNNLGTKTEQETLEAFKTVFGGWVENYNSTMKETNKTAVLTKEKLVKNNIQPPGGAGPQPQPTNYMKSNPMTGKKELNWDVLREQAAAMLGGK